MNLPVMFDINEYLNSRKRKNLKKAQSFCPHIGIIKEKENVFLKACLFLLGELLTGFASIVEKKDFSLFPSKSSTAYVIIIKRIS